MGIIYDEAGEVFDVNSTEHIVAFVDALGTKNIMEKDEKAYNNEPGYEHLSPDGGLKLFYLLYTRFLESMKNKKQFKGITVKIFSDNILIVSELSTDNEIKTQEIRRFLAAVNYFQSLCISWSRVFIRGGISIGRLFIDDNFVYGKALVKAYEMENKKAIYPRIILEKGLYESLPLAEIVVLDPLFKDMFIQDIDGYYFLNYMQSCQFDAPEQTAKIGQDKVNLAYAFHREMIQKTTTEAVKRGDYGVLVKMAWVSRYHNDFCRKHKGENHIIA